MKQTEIRQIRNRAELEECYDLWGNVFAENEPRSFFQERLDHDESYRFETTWVAKVDGEIVSSIQIFPYKARIGDITLHVGGIGNVATNPIHRGRGLALEILHTQNVWMEGQGFDLSLLFTGLYSFYDKAGWRQISEEMFGFDRDSVLKKPLLAHVSYESGEIEQAILPRDIENLKYVYEEFNKKQNNSMVRSKRYWLNQIKWKNETSGNFLVKKENELITAYIRFRNRDLKTEILEACCLNGKEDELTRIFAKLLCSQDCANEVAMRVPKQHILTEVLEKMGVKPVTFQSAMWKFFDFKKLMSKLEPVLQERAYSRLEIVKGKTVLIRCDDDCVMLDFNEAGELSVHFGSVHPRYDEYINLTSTEFLGLLTQGIRFLSGRRLSHHPYLKLLFPNQGGILWSSDFF